MEYSSQVKSDNPLVMFLYSLMSAGVHPKQVEKAVDEVKELRADSRYTEDGMVTMADGPLALMAQEAARELVGEGTIANGGENCGYEKEIHGQEGKPEGKPAEPCAEVATGPVGEPERKAQG